jgi:lipoate-protein ligase A
MKWRVIELETHDAFTNMALDETAEESIRTGEAPPTIRFYRWKPSAVSIGCFQGLDEEVDTEACNRLGVDYVRRRTGGGAVYHDENGEITYSIIAKEGSFPKGIRESYRAICSCVVAGLADLGIQAEFVPINDVVVGGRKISGSAQTRREGVLLQHGTVLYDIDMKTMFSLLKISREKISDKAIKSAGERVTSVKDHSSATIGDLYNSLLNGFLEGRKWEFGYWTEKERERAEELSESYRSREWNFSR